MCSSDLEPDFQQREGSFVVTLWRDWLTDDVLSKLGISERQKQAVDYVKKNMRITNLEYQQLTDVARKTATRDLEDLVEKSILDLRGKKRGSHYVLKGKK